jgi:hypothetical protein
MNKVVKPSNELRNIFLHHILLFLDVTEKYEILKFETNPFYKKNWYKHSRVCCDSQTKIYRVNGKWHREDGPAIEWGNGHKEWYINGKYHREDGPAIESDGGKLWYFHGILHRLDGPAVEWGNGDKEWRVNGKLHRLNGPAIEYKNRKEWWVNGEKTIN